MDTKNDFGIKNYMEEVVNFQIDDVLKIMDVCRCDKCRLDMTAIALNDLPPKYVVTEKGELYSKVNNLINQFDVDVCSAIAKAAIIVGKNPRHINRHD